MRELWIDFGFFTAVDAHLRQAPVKGSGWCREHKAEGCQIMEAGAAALQRREWISIQLALLSHWIGPCAEATVLAPAEGHARRRWPRARTGRRGGSRERARRRWRRPRARRRQPRRGLVGESMALRACSYGCIRVFLALSLLLLAVEFAAYLQGWHLEEVALLLAVDGLFAASYVGWMRLRLNYLAPPL
uniref:Uncharacterized protein n=1 Tax=Oryza glumipatula TaxID=40148 RepID=A0A0E0BBB0_9ORYZ